MISRSVPLSVNPGPFYGVTLVLAARVRREGFMSDRSADGGQPYRAPALLPGSVTKCQVGREPCASLETFSQASQVFIRSP
jgi:hypothetical protein